MAHVGIAAITGSQRWTLDDTEGDKLAKAVQQVTRHYNIPDVASETKDWIGLIIVAGTIYGTRFASMMMDRNAPPPAPPAQDQDDKVVSIIGSLNHSGVPNNQL